MIKCVLFDLDGVLADATEWHYHAFNQALKESGFEPIPYDTHIKHYNGLPTAVKIDKLKSSGINITPEVEKTIRISKQKATVQCIKNYCAVDETKTKLINTLKKMGYITGVCTNAVRETLDLILEKLELDQFDLTLSNQDIKHPKPSPEIYQKAMEKLNVTPEETLIVEDSPKGIKAAKASGAHVLEVSGYADVHQTSVLRKITQINYNNLQILIPMAGRGTRFARVGYTVPKPMIPVLGKPMIHHVIDNLNIDGAKWHFVVLSDHLEEYDKLHELPGNIVKQHGMKQGAACSASLAFEHLNPDDPVLVANSDQFIDMNILDFLTAGINCDGAIMTFKSNHPKWSYASVDENEYVNKVKEKVVISDNATSGIYLWNKASSFIQGIKDMIEAGDTHNNEYYIAPSFNYCITRGLKYRLMHIKKQQMWGLGTPEDLIKFVDHYEK